MKLLIATPLLSSQIGGPSQYAVGLKNSFELRGHQTKILAFQEVVYLPSGLRHCVLFFKALVRSRGVDAVIVLDTFSVALPTVIAAFLLNKKIILRTGGDFVWEQYVSRTHQKVLLSKFYTTSVMLSMKEKFCIWLQKRIIFPLTDVLVFSTKWQWDIWALPYELANRKVVVIENAYAGNVLKGRSGGDSTVSNRIVWIGRNIPLKNVETLDGAIKKVQTRCPQLEYKKYSSLPHNEVIEVLANSRALVVPSFSEVSPNIVFEALNTFVPVLLTADCGLRDHLGDSVVWIDPLSEDAIASHIEEIMTDKGYALIRQKMESLVDDRTYEVVADDFLRLLNSME